jgi:uncharacterized protein (DUF1499 family)
MRYKTMAALMLSLALAAVGCSGKRPENLGVVDGQLLPCPASPNCVVSRSDDPDHFIEPIRYRGGRASAVARLREIVEGMKRAHVVVATDDYLHVEFFSPTMGFGDDAEFFFGERGRILVRSAARLGHSDFGVNRERMERIRALMDR